MSLFAPKFMQPVSVSLRTPLDFSAKEVFDWHLKPSALERLVPPWLEVKVLSKEGGPNLVGSRIVLKVKVGPFWVRSCFQHVAFEDEHYFTDVQVAGPFKFWKHIHKVHSLGDHSCELVDEIQFIPLFGLFAGFVKKQIERALRWRHARVKAELGVLAKYPTDPMKILVSGSSGLIGRSVVSFLSGAGHEVYRLVRKPEEEDEKAIYWNPKAGIGPLEDFEGFDAVIHLAGKNVAQGVWSEKFKKAIFSSRVEYTQMLTELFNKLKSPPKVFVCASALGFYGNRGEESLTEESEPGEGFLASVCQDWEKVAQEAKNMRVIRTRFGIVLSPSGGVLKRLVPVFKMGLGAWFGSGRQWVSWIALDDVVYGIYHVLLKSVEGPVNFCSPEPLRAKSFYKELAEALSRPLWFHVGEKGCHLLFGQMADEMLLTSQKAVAAKLQSSGYSFQYKALKPLFSSVL